MLTPVYAHKKFKKLRPNRRCSWCGYTNELWIHQNCKQRPDYHNWEAYWNWMTDKERPTRNGRSTRVLSDKERKQYEEWLEYKMMKEDDIRNDEIRQLYDDTDYGQAKW